MNGLISEIHDDLHIVHKSILVLLLKGGAAWLLATILLVSLEQLTGLFTAFQTQTPNLTLTSTAPTISSVLIIRLIGQFCYGLLVLYIVLNWLYEFYITQPSGIIVRRGIIFSKEIQYSLGAIQSIGVQQGILGRIFNFGTVILYNPVLKSDLKLEFIHNPYGEAQFIQKIHPNPEIIHFLPKASLHSSGQFLHS